MRWSVLAAAVVGVAGLIGAASAVLAQGGPIGGPAAAGPATSGPIGGPAAAGPATGGLTTQGNAPIGGSGVSGPATTGVTSPSAPGGRANLSPPAPGPGRVPSITTDSGGRRLAPTRTVTPRISRSRRARRDRSAVRGRGAAPSAAQLRALSSRDASNRAITGSVCRGC